MTELVEAGKVRRAGVSDFDVALLERCEAIRHVDSLQPMLNAIAGRWPARCCPGARRTAPASSPTAP